jgi:hypothetical protein
LRRRARLAFAAALSAAVLTSSCRDAVTVVPGIGARVTLDRSEARVGDPIGVTVEVETPEGFALQTPPAPGDGPFASDSVRVVEPIATDSGLRHHLLWTVRAREVGDQTLPWLEIPLVRPDGAVQPLRVGGVPLAVRSVRADLPPREVVFDIREAPPLEPTPIWVWALGAAAIGVSVVGARALRRRARRIQATSTKLAETGRAALAELAEAERDADARAFAGRVRAALLNFVGGVWSVDTASATPAELPPAVDRELVRILHALELARFAKRPALAPLTPLASQARERVRHVANLRA